MTLHPRNTQSDWMGEKEETVKQMFKDFGMDVITKKYKVLQCFPKDVDPSLVFLSYTISLSLQCSMHTATNEINCFLLCFSTVHCLRTAPEITIVIVELAFVVVEQLY